MQTTSPQTSSPTKTEEEKQVPSHFDSIKTKSEAMSLIKKAVATNNYITNKITSQEKIIEEKQNEVKKLKEDLRIQKSIFSKCTDKASNFEKQYESLRSEREFIEGKIKDIENNDQEQYEKVKADADAVAKEVHMLKKHNKMLMDELENQENNKKNSLNCMSSYEMSLTKMQEYFLTMFEPRVFELIKSFKSN